MPNIIYDTMRSALRQATDALPLTGGSLTGSVNLEQGGYRYTVDVIPEEADEVELHEGWYSHIPSAAPTYILPDVAQPGETFEIILEVRFSANVTSIAFQDSSETIITPRPGPTPAAGMVVCYRCTWEPLLGQWCILPVELGTYSA